MLMFPAPPIAPADRFNPPVVDAAVVLIAHEDAYVSAHTIVMASEELIRTLADKKGTPYGTDWRTRVNPKYRPKAHNYIRDKYNFFKHADRDIDKVLEIDPEEVRGFNAAVKAAHSCAGMGASRCIVREGANQCVNTSRRRQLLASF